MIDEKGQVVGQDPANAPASRSDFRSLAAYHESPGTWKLRLENTSKAEASVAAAAWSDTTPNALIITASKADAAGKVSIVGRPLVNNLPAQGAHLVARLRSNDGKTVDVTLSDDGKSGDGAAGDGVYGIIADKLAPGTYLVEAKAEIDGQTLASAAGFEIPEPEARSAKKAVQK